MKKLIEYLYLYFKDKNVRLNFSFFLSLILNSLYIIFNLTSGIALSDVWLVALSAYYSLIVLLRYLVISDGDEATEKSLENTKSAGKLMQLLTLPLSGIIFFTVVNGYFPKYSGAFLIFPALHSIFSTVRSFFAFFDKEGRKNISLRAAHSVRLSGALMSFFNFQSAFLPRLPIADDVRMLLNFLTGSVASIAVFILATRIVADANKSLASKRT